MSEAKPTPGPWSVEWPDYDAEHEAYHDPEAGTYSGHAKINAKGWSTFARVAVMCNGDPDNSGRANAALIAAAPELLAALKRIRDVRDCLAEHGRYPASGDGPNIDQDFDDWAADVANVAIDLAEPVIDRSPSAGLLRKECSVAVESTNQRKDSRDGPTE